MNGDAAFRRLHDAEGAERYWTLMARVRSGTPLDADAALAEMRSLVKERDGEADWLTYWLTLSVSGRRDQAWHVLDDIVDRFGDTEMVACAGARMTHESGDAQAAREAMQFLALIGESGQTETGRAFATVLLHDTVSEEAVVRGRSERIAALRTKADANTASGHEIVELGRLLLEADYADPDAGLRFDAAQRLMAARTGDPENPALLAVLAEHLGRIGASDYHDALDELARLDPTAALVQAPPELASLRAMPSPDLETRMLRAVLSIGAPGGASDAGEIVHTAGLKAAYFPHVPGLRVPYAVGLAFIGERELALAEADRVADLPLTHTQHFNLATVYAMCGRLEAAQRQALQAQLTARTDDEARDADTLIAQVAQG